MVTPVLDPLNGNTNYSAYFPAGNWVNLADLDEIYNIDYGQSIKIKTKAKVNAYLMEGALVPYQNNNDMRINTTTTLLQAPIDLIINRDNVGHAIGTLLLDQGSSRFEIDNSFYEYYEIRH
jgi:alpha-glucosidase (family GH31 glycosyl hydrolase)